MTRKNHKECKTCHQTKRLTSFGMTNRKYYRCICKKCVASLKRIEYALNPERQKKYSSEWTKRNMDKHREYVKTYTENNIDQIRAVARRNSKIKYRKLKLLRDKYSLPCSLHEITNNSRAFREELYIKCNVPVSERC